MPEVLGFRFKCGDSNGSIEAGVLGLPWDAPNGERTAPEALCGIVVDESGFSSKSIGAGGPRVTLLIDVEVKLSIFPIANPALAFNGDGAVN